MPALLTSTSTPFHAATTSATADCTCCSLLTSIATAMAWPPWRLISSAAACAESWLRSATTTLAPSRAKRAAISLPMPLAAPVTMQTLLSSFMVCSGCERYSTGQVVVHDRAEAQGQVRQDVRAGEHFEHRQSGHRCQRVVGQLQRGRA